MGATWNQCDVQLGLIFGGTGVTPMLQAASAALERGGGCRVAMLGSYRQHRDILCIDKIEHLLSSYREEKISIKYTFTGEETEPGHLCVGEYFNGRVNADMLKACLPLPEANTKIFVSGPEGMMQAVVVILGGLGYDPSMIIELEA